MRRTNQGAYDHCAAVALCTGHFKNIIVHRDRSYTYYKGNAGSSLEY